jgi:hypothetical protein
MKELEVRVVFVHLSPEENQRRLRRLSRHILRVYERLSVYKGRRKNNHNSCPVPTLPPEENLPDLDDVALFEPDTASEGRR